MADYKLVRLHFKNTRHTNIFYANRFLDKWVDRVCQCENMELTQKSDLSSYTYYAIFNYWRLGLIFNSAGYPYFGTRKLETGTNALYGIQALLGDFACNYEQNYYYPFGAECSLIIDSDNNLVSSTPLITTGESAYNMQGFMFTNGGLLNLAPGANNNRIYSVSNNPTIIALTEPYNSPYQYLANLKCERSDGDNPVVVDDDILIDSNNNIIGIRDHVKLIMAPELMRAANSAGLETIVVDDALYVHVGPGYTWIPITGIEDEEIEVSDT